MLKRLPIVAVVLIAAVAVQAENGFNAVSVTATSATTTFASPRVYVTLCNYGANEAYYRIFEAPDTPGAATTANASLAPGSATAPVCVAWPKSATYYTAVSLVCDTAETATVHILSQR